MSAETLPAPPTQSEVIVSLALNTPAGETVLYETLMMALNTEDREVAQKAVSKANRRLRERGHELLPVVNEGYRLSLARENVALAKRKNRIARRRQRDALTLVDATDTGSLTAPERNELARMRVIQHALVAHAVATERRLGRVDDLLAKLTGNQIAMAEQLDQHRDKILLLQSAQPADTETIGGV